MIWLLLACSSDEPCTDMTQSPGALTVTEEEHALGWGESECAQCHPAWTLHQRDCVGVLDLEELEARTDLSDTTSCVACHGTNGAPELDTGSER
ncbi:MAG: hypothetical protein GY913_35905 [Proteobacteria bacterium]|nr:hypothetical protein [Pseudomonadota bacterium]MCP4922316.1 hypothetical protein [Pseudomonadota bacterium]